MFGPLFKPSDIANIIVKEYKLKWDKSQTDQIMEALKKKIKAVSEGIHVQILDSNGKPVLTTLYEVSKRGQNSRNDHLYTSDEVQQILIDEELYKYIQKNLMPPECKEEFREHKRIADEWNAAYREDFLREQEEIPDGYGSYVSVQDVEKKKLQIMIEALFLRYFTPIDTDRLRKDMELVNSYSGTDEYTPQAVAAYQRLMNPQEKYYKPQKQDGKN